jgi:hypothetical protein
MAVSLHDWFCLKPGRDNFKPNNVADADLIFCHDHLVNDQIIGSIERRFAGNEPVKMLIYGDWGVGKTHTINHICKWLAQRNEEYPCFPVIIEIGDITNTARFDALVRPFIDKLGSEFLVQLVHRYITLHPGAVRALEQAGVAPHIASAFGKFLLATPGDTPPPVVTVAMDYLRGRKLSAQASSMGFTQQLTDSKDFYDVLLAIGEMYRSVHNHRILFIADEAAKLEAVDADDATRAHWVNANKLIFDDNNRTFGFLYTVSGRRRDLPQALIEPQLQNRLGDNAFEMPNLETGDVSQFIQRLRNAFIDQVRTDSLAQNGMIGGQRYSWSNYPFTAEGHAAFLDYFNRTSENAKPRDISVKLNDVGFIASKLGLRLIDPQCIERAQM